MRMACLLIGAILLVGCRAEVPSGKQATKPDKPATPSLSVAEQEQAAEAAQAEFDSLKAQLETDLAEVRAQIANLETESQKLELFSEKNPIPKYVDDMLALAEMYPSTDVGVEAALSAVAQSSGEQKSVAMNFLLDSFADRLDLPSIVTSLQKEIPSPAIESWIKKMISLASGDQKPKTILGYAIYFKQIPAYSSALAKNPHLLARMPLDQREYLTEPRPTAQTEEVDAFLNQVIETYADVPFQGSRTCGEVAKRELYALRFLSVGKLAPEIYGEDLDGAEFKLSDYQGKVVMLDFWGHWCGPCRDMYPHERHIVETLNGLPFALVGINSDQSRSLAQRVVRDEPLPWRNFWNGPDGMNGTISSEWNVDAWPTVFLIDGKGVIRYKDVLGEDLDRAIEQLMAEMGHTVDLSGGTAGD